MRAIQVRASILDLAVLNSDAAFCACRSDRRTARPEGGIFGEKVI